VTLLVCWALAPLVLAVLSLGCGSLLELASGRRLPGVLLVPAGFALVIVVLDLATRSPSTAPLGLPAVLALCTAGWLGGGWRRVRPSPWVAGSVAVVYLAFAAPVLFSGEATFAGYIKLDDTATWFAFTDRVLDHGRTLTGLDASTYLRTLSVNLATGYPLGAFLPLAAVRKLLHWDVAWLFAPYLAFQGALLACAMHGLLERPVPAARRRALVVAVAAQPALLYGYAMWGGIKELVSAQLVATTAALLPDPQPDLAHVRALLPALVGAVALVACLSLGGVVWLAPLGGWVVLVLVRWARQRVSVRSALIVAALVAAAVLVAVLTASGGFLERNFPGLQSNADPGNLLHPLSAWQAFGVWPAGDFRVHPSEQAITRLLLVAVLLGIIAALALALRAHGGRLLAYAGGTVAGMLVVAVVGNHWITGKAMAIGSPAVLLLALSGVALLWQAGRHAETVVLATMIAGGVVWSNVLAYHEVDLAPRAQLAELQTIGRLIAGRGPALMTEFEPYGVRHFLRDGAAEGASELRVRPVELLAGGYLGKGAYADLDAFQQAAILLYPTLVLRTSPVASRPPSVYRLAWSGRWYEVWQRPLGARAGSQIVAHLPLGDPLHPGAVPDCGTVLALARTPGVRTLVAPPRANPVVTSLVPGVPAPDGVLYPEGATTVTVRVLIPHAGLYAVWLGGSAKGRVTVSIDGRRTGSISNQLQNEGQYLPLGTLTLGGGLHSVTVRYTVGVLRPGSGGDGFPLGPLVLQPLPDLGPLLRVSAANARALCGRTLDWVEALSA
jgi:hypothetical protein